MITSMFLSPDDDFEKPSLDACDVLPRATEEEVAEGNRLGQEIDPGDDGDSGLTKVVSLRALSDHDKAVAKARRLKSVMLAHGVPEVSIELQAGRPNSYGTWDALFPVCDMSHHTVSRYSPGSLTPCLSLVKFGRPDLPGPLCNGYGGWDLCYRIISFGYANHPGYGGPYTVPALTSGAFTIPKDSARRYAWGTEFEGGINEADWDKVLTNPRTGDKMTFREFMGRCNAALEEFLEIHEKAHLEHSTWAPTRKIDRLHYDAAKGIKEKAPYRNQQAQTKDWFDMATQKDLEDAIQHALGSASIVVQPKTSTQERVVWRFDRVLRALLNDEGAIKRALASQTDDLVQKLTDAVVAALPTAPAPMTDAPSLTADDVQGAVERGIRNVLGGLDEGGETA